MISMPVESVRFLSFAYVKVVTPLSIEIPKLMCVCPTEFFIYASEIAMDHTNHRPQMDEDRFRIHM